HAVGNVDIGGDQYDGTERHQHARQDTDTHGHSGQRLREQSRVVGQGEDEAGVDDGSDDEEEEAGAATPLEQFLILGVSNDPRQKVVSHESRLHLISLWLPGCGRLGSSGTGAAAVGGCGHGEDCTLSVLAGTGDLSRRGVPGYDACERTPWAARSLIWSIYSVSIEAIRRLHCPGAQRQLCARRGGPACHASGLRPPHPSAGRLGGSAAAGPSTNDR